MSRFIMHVIAGLNRGGAESHLVDLVREQIAGGDRTEVAYLRGDGYWAPALRQLGATVYDLRLKAYGDPLPVFRLRRLIAKAAPDLLHLHMPPAELYTRLALLRGPRVPIAVTKHNDEPFYRGPFADPVGKWVARQAEMLIGVSDAVSRYMTERLAIDPDRIRTIRYGVNPGPYQAVTPEEAARFRAAFGIAPEHLLIGTVCRLVPQKAVEVLLEAFSLLSLPHARLMIVGAGPLERELKAEAARLGITGRVIWTGFRDDIALVMNAFDIFTLSSDFEGFGLVLLEAMASATPVVATRVSAIPEVIADGETGLLVPRRNPAAFADALTQLASPERRAAMGAAGAARAEARFTVAAMHRATSLVYERVLASAR